MEIDILGRMAQLGASHDELERMKQYIQAENALRLTRKALGIGQLYRKYFNLRPWKDDEQKIQAS